MFLPSSLVQNCVLGGKYIYLHCLMPWCIKTRIICWYQRRKYILWEHYSSVNPVFVWWSGDSFEVFLVVLLRGFTVSANSSFGKCWCLFLLHWPHMGVIEFPSPGNSIPLQPHAQANNKGNIMALHYWPLCWVTTDRRWIPRLPVDSPHKRPIMEKVCPYPHVFMDVQQIDQLIIHNVKTRM